MSLYTTFIYIINYSAILSFSFYISSSYFAYNLYDYLTESYLEEYDYIIVGAGSAGSIVALRLAQKGERVLILEAGSHGDAILDIPAFGPLLQGSEYDWKYQTETQEKACLGLKNQKSLWPMGKLVGGTGRFNNLIYSRGNAKDYEYWYTNATDYQYERDILWYFKKSEHHTGRFISDSKYHSTAGPLRVSDLPFYTNFSSALLQAAFELGYYVGDLNSQTQTGFMESQVNLHTGKRWSTGHSLLQEQPDHNLNLLTSSFVTKILFHTNFEAKAVQFVRFSRNITVSARKGVILTAGVIGTPKILLLSGIGPSEHLSSIGIDPWNNLPVGENLMDHLTTGLDLIELNAPLSVSVDAMLSPLAAWKYFHDGSGPWTTPGCEVIGMINSDNSNETAPDLQFMFLPSGVSADGGIQLRHLFGLTDTVWDGYFATFVGRPMATLLPIILHPQSRGTVRLPSNDPFATPLINPRYLTEDSDVGLLVKGIKFIAKLLQMKSLRDFGAKLNDRHFPGCEGYVFGGDPYWECYVRHLSLTSYHPAGTCRMGAKNDPAAVVDFKFKVHGTNKLYIADASVMPSLPSGNINAVVVMIAEKVADEIIKEQFLLNGTSNKYDVFSMRCV